MATKRPSHPEPDDDELETVTKPEADEPAYMNPVVEEQAAVNPLAPTNQQAQAHQAAVTAAVGVQTSAAQSAVTSLKAGSITQAQFLAALKSASITYYQSVLSSAQANSQPAAGAIQALQTLGAF